MQRHDIYKTWFDQERFSNQLMLKMLHGVPLDSRHDERYTRAVNLAAHLVACRTNWLDRMTMGGKSTFQWWPDGDIETLDSELCEMETTWEAYLASLTNDDLDRDFEFPSGESRFRWNIEGQLRQLVGHAFYHRGQIATLVEQLGGETFDTDYLFWAYKQDPGSWGKLPLGQE